MHGRHLMLREAVTIGGLPPVKLFPLPTRISVLDVPLICLSLPAHKYAYRSGYQYSRPLSCLKPRISAWRFLLSLASSQCMEAHLMF